MTKSFRIYSRFFIILFYLFLIVSVLLAKPTDSLLVKTDSLRNALQLAKADTVRLRLLETLVRINEDTNPAQCIKWLRDGIEISRKNRDIQKRIAFQVHELRLLNIQGAYEEVRRKGEAIATEVNLLQKHQVAAAFYMSMANAAQRLGDYNAAFEYNRLVVEIGRAHRLPLIEVRASMNIALLYDFLGQFENMRKFLYETLSMAQRYKLEEDIAMIRFNISNAEAKLNNFGKSIELVHEVIPYYKKQHQFFAVALCYANLAWCYYKTQKYDQALDYVNKSRSLRLQINDQTGLGRLEYISSRIFLDLRRFDSALYYAEKGLKRSNNLRLVVDIRNGYETLAMIYEQQGKFDKAYSAQKQFISWKDSANRIDLDKQLNLKLAGARYQSLDSLQSNLIDARTQLKQFRSVLLILGILASILLFILIVWKKRYQRSLRAYQEKLSKGTEEKITDAELAAVKRSYLHKIELADEELKQYRIQLDEYKIRVDELDRRLQIQSTSDIQAIRHIIESNKLHSEGYWNEFLLLFSKIYPDFFEKLKERYPELTQNELRLCALIKLNIGLLDMASALNITTESARKARYRLYKKLHLNSDQELSDLIIRT